MLRKIVSIFVSVGIKIVPCRHFTDGFSMRISFYLDKPSAPQSVVMLNVAFFGQRLRFGTGISVESAHWNIDRQEPRSTDPFRNTHHRRLNSITTAVHTIYDEMRFGNRDRVVSSDDSAEFKSRIQAFLTPETSRQKHNNNFIDNFNEFVERYTKRTISGMVTSARPLESTIQKYRLVRSSLEEWGREHRREVKYETMTLDFYMDYSRWLAQTRNLVDSSVSNYIKVLKTFLKWSHGKGYHTSVEYERFYRDKRNGETIALSIDELRAIRECDLSDSPRLSRVRDHFLLQCYTGMRYGDLIKLEPRHFDDAAGVIRFTTQKTQTNCIIPITAPLHQLMERYPSRLFEFPSDVKQNLYLKELGRRVGFAQSVAIGKYIGGKRVETVKKKHELLTTHVARRSFATTSIQFGIPESVIAVVTGHSAKGMLQQHYIKLNEEAVRDLVCKGWEQL